MSAVNLKAAEDSTTGDQPANDQKAQAASDQQAE
jgi:hypothetical protein